MIDFSLLHYLIIAIIVAAPAGAVALGQARICMTVIDTVQEQPAAQSKLFTLFFISLAISETAAILCLLLGLILFFSDASTFERTLSLIGIIFGLVIPCSMSGFLSWLPARQALKALARQPFEYNKILNILLLGLSILQTPVIFGLLVALLIQQATVTSVAHAISLIGAGIGVGIGSLGPTLGLSHFSQTACSLIGIQPQSYRYLLNFVLMSQALIETPILFGCIIALLIFTLKANSIATAIICVSAAFATGFCTFGPGISSGRTAAAAATAMAKNASAANLVARSSLISQALIDTSALYGFLCGMILLLFK